MFRPLLNLRNLTRSYHCLCGVRDQFKNKLSENYVRNRVIRNRTVADKASFESSDHTVPTYFNSSRVWEEEDFVKPHPHFDWPYLTNPENVAIIERNIHNRKGVGDIKALQTVYWHLKKLLSETELENLLEGTQHDRPPDEEVTQLRSRLLELAADIPNISHPDTPIGDESASKVIATHGKKRDFNFKPKSVIELGENLNMLRTKHTGPTSGPRTYYFLGPLAQLEHALIQFTTDVLLEKGFTLMSLPDLIHPAIVEGCGFKVDGERTQVYKLDPSLYPATCLAGTGEMPLAGFFMSQVIPFNDLPVKVMAVSRCFRAEVSSLEEEGGIYRVHQFSKVEMFGVCGGGSESAELMEEIAEIQGHLFTQLGLHFRTMEMASHELGAPAYRKYDCEAWMAAQDTWGEISSTSNCTDYQSRRLNVSYSDLNDNKRFCHTVNGTACAVPRMIMALLEANQQQDGTVSLPAVLQPYMNGITRLVPLNHPQPHWLKYKGKL